MKSKKKHRTSRHATPSKSALLDAFTEKDLETWDTRSTDPVPLVVRWPRRHESQNV